MKPEQNKTCQHCGHIESDHAEHDSQIGTFAKGQCLRVGCGCKQFTEDPK